MNEYNVKKRHEIGNDAIVYGKNNGAIQNDSNKPMKEKNESPPTHNTATTNRLQYTCANGGAAAAGFVPVR